MLPTKLRSERCANDLNHFQLKVPSGTFSIAEIGLSVDSPICRSVVRVLIPDSVQLVVSLGRTLRSHCLAVLQTALSKTWGRTYKRRLMLLQKNTYCKSSDICILHFLHCIATLMNMPQISWPYIAKAPLIGLKKRSLFPIT